MLLRQNSRQKQTEHKNELKNNRKRTLLSNVTNFKSPPMKKAKNFNENGETVPGMTPVTRTKSCEVPQAISQRTEAQISSRSQGSLTQSSQSLTQNPFKSEDGVKMMRSIKKVLEDNFKNVSERLQLQSVPQCLYDLKNCRESHSKKVFVDIAGCESQYLAKNFLGEDRAAQFLMYVRNSICGKKKFPGVEVVFGVLEMILKTSPDDTKTISTSSQTVTELYSLFLSILNTFPPCHVRDLYLRVLESPFIVHSIHIDSPDRGILHAMLELLQDLITGGQDLKQKSRKSLHHDNFFLWDAQNEEKFSFLNFSRDEKFSRIFAVIDLVTTLLESDLAMFIIKNSRNLRTSIQDDTKRPLICPILWQSYESVVVVNSTIKMMIEIFVNMTGLKYPVKDIRIISRLLNLVANVTNLYEYPDETFEYPSHGSLTKDLVQSLITSIEASVYYSPELFTEIAENLRSPLLKMLLMHDLVTRIRGRTSDKISIEVPFKCIRNKEWKQFKDVDALEKQVTLVSPLTSSPISKFPILNSKIKPKKFKSNQKNFLKALQIYTKATNDFYRIKNCVREIVKSDSSCLPEKQLNPDKSSLEEKVTLRAVDLNFNKLVHIKLNLETCRFYRNEIKYFMLMPQLIRKCSERYGETFEGWMELVKLFEV